MPRMLHVGRWCWTRPCSRMIVYSSQVFCKQNTALALAVIIGMGGDSIHLHIARFNLKTHSQVKRNGCFVDGGSDTVNARSSLCTYGIKECFVQESRYARFAVFGMDADKMNIRLIGVGLRQEAIQKANDVGICNASIFDDRIFNACIC